MFRDGSDDLLWVGDQGSTVGADGGEGGTGGAFAVGFSSLKESDDKFGFLCKESGDGVGIVLGAKCGGLVDEAFG